MVEVKKGTSSSLKTRVETSEVIRWQEERAL